MVNISSTEFDLVSYNHLKTNSGSDSTEKLDKSEQEQVQKLKKRDDEVRTHEMAHSAAGGQYIKSGVSYEYQSGPDGQRYAIGGEVSIDTSPVKGDPEATIKKMQVVKRAALAPASPSGQDKAVAASAAVTEAQARQELAAQKSGGSDSVSGASVDNKYNRQGRVSETGTKGTLVNLSA